MFAGLGNMSVSNLPYQFLHPDVRYDSDLHHYNSVATSKLQERQVRSASGLLGLF